MGRAELGEGQRELLRSSKVVQRDERISPVSSLPSDKEPDFQHNLSEYLLSTTRLQPSNPSLLPYPQRPTQMNTNGEYASYNTIQPNPIRHMPTWLLKAEEGGTKESLIR